MVIAAILHKFPSKIPSLSLQTLKFSSFSRPKPQFTFSHAFQLCSRNLDFNSGRAAHAQMLISNFTPTTFVYNCLISMYVKCGILDFAHNVFDKMPVRDVVSWNAIISGYTRNGLMESARCVFDNMPERDVVSWNSVISGYLQNGRMVESIACFLDMRVSSVCGDPTTFAVVMKICASLEDVGMGSQIHGLAMKTGLVSDVMTGSALVDMYAKCGLLEESILIFGEMSKRNYFSWSALIGGCAQNGQFVNGLEFFKEMQRAGVGVDQSTYASVFRSCAGLSSAGAGAPLHAHAVKTNFTSDSVVGTAIVDMYAKAGRCRDSFKVFQGLWDSTMQSWNAIVVGFARNNLGSQSMQLFRMMVKSGIGLSEISLSAVLRACAEVKGYLQGLQVHGLAIKTSFISDICVSNALLDMYGKCKTLTEAYCIFEEMELRDAVSWNVIITALGQNGFYEDTLLHLYELLYYGMKPDEFTYGSVLKACAGLQSLCQGVKVHEKIIKSGLGLNPFVGSSLVDMYCKCGMMEEAQKLHARLEEQTLESSNAIISGFSLQKKSEDAQKFFSQMLVVGLEPDNFTYATVLDTCANLATICLGKQIHAQVIKQELLKDVYIGSTLVDMYSKCGNMNDALVMFDRMTERDFVSWNAMICGYAHHGLGLEALHMFEKMRLNNVKPNHATFVAVLRACGHVALFDEGICYFHLMNHYKLEPQLEHYSCMVDILGRSKGTAEALKLIKSMPFEADVVIWKALLGVCKIQKDVDVAEVAANNIMALDPEDSSACILLSNIYADAGKWEKVSKMRRWMRESNLKKEPGCSWIEVKNEVHTFLVGDKAHPRCNEIYERLDELIAVMKWEGYLSEIDLFSEDEKFE